MKLTREQAIAEHRKMWNWVADETIKDKESVSKCAYFAVNFTIDIPSNYCYCCEYANSIARPTSFCCACPIKWEYGHCSDSEYKDWLIAHQANDYKSAAKYARIIANLPERLD